ncbi:MAG: methylmalonyl-CoA mutase family protein [Chloroflexi bacterium]|nr:methylmalonyl-CoA mutase family protein [Chloroflexota bacterium]
MTHPLPERRDTFETTSGIEIKRVYTARDLPAGLDDELGAPGRFPFTRGIQPTMYRGRLWTMRQYAGYATAEESNRRYRYLLEHGQTGLSVAFDLPTQIGLDPDAPAAEGEVGRVGVSIASLKDMETLFDGIALRDVSTSMTINATAAILLALYIAVAKKQGASPAELRGTVQNDILKEYLARGTYIYPPAPSMRLVTDIIAYCSREMPRWNPISISGYHLREAGATAVQEIAFTFADAIAYVEAVLARGLSIDDFAPQLSFFFVAQNDLFEEAAKYRAARRLWARLMKERFGAQDPKSLMLRFHTQTAGAALTAQQPLNNVVRVTLQALGAVLGGTQSLHCNAFDEALALPMEESARLALRTQQIIAYESGVADTVDPLAGSYYVENLTDEIERRAREYLDRIEQMGGALKAIENGYMQQEIHESAYRMQRQIETKERIVVGVNEFQVEERVKPQLLQISPDIERQQRQKVAELRASRDAAAASEALHDLRDAACGDGNLLPPILDCVERYVTVGEIAGLLRTVFGEYQAR